MTKSLKTLIIFLSILILDSIGLSQVMQTYQLKNGIRVILSPIENVQSVCVFTYIKTGVRDDPINLKGASTIFKNIRYNSATKNFAYLKGFLNTKNNGGIVGSNIEYDFSYFYQIVPKEDINIALMLEGERLKSLKINKLGFQIQKKKHLQKLTQRVRFSSYYNSIQWTNLRLFAHSVYQYPLMGILNKIRNISIDDISSVYNRYSDPNLITLVITGKFKTVNIKRKIIRHFSNIKFRKKKKLTYRSLNLKGNFDQSTEIIKNATNNFIVFGIQAPSVLDSNFTPFLLMKYFLLDARGGNIRSFLKNNHNLDLSINYRLSDNIEANSLIIKMSSRKKINIIKTKFLLLSYFKKLPTFLLKKNTEIINTKYMMEIDFLKKLSGLASRSEILAKSEHFYSNLDIYNNILQKTKNVNISNLIEISKKYFTKDRITILYGYND